MARMTPEAIQQAIKESDGWQKPEFNEQLYLQCKGFASITPAISEYTNVKALWLQQNALSKVENLEPLPLLGCLFLHQNCISRISGLGHLRHLHTLNLSNNYITKVEGLAGLPLETLQLSHNRIAKLADLRGLAECPSIGTLDISHNQISVDKEAGEQSEDLIALLREALAELKCLYVQGNEIGGQTRYWRRKVVGGIKTLTYMDERPVFEEERHAVDAWMVGGFEAEQAERDRLRAAKKAEEKESMRKWKEMQDKGRAIKEQSEREMQQREAERKEWRAELNLTQVRERRECENDFMDVRAELWHRETRERKEGLMAAEEESRGAAQRQQQSREEREATERAAREDIELEERELAERRRQYAEELRTQQLSLQQELDFLARESERECAADEAALKEIVELAVNGPAAVDAAVQPLLAAAAEKPVRHVDPAAAAGGSEEAAPAAPAGAAPRPQQQPQPRRTGGFRPNAATAAVWQRYAQWESRLQRKA
eukprot:TRINITY_DN50125_c0_g1_i1.p1 TRINITY_DN50125_c0_g1~~TRINITY_DN50125_c0_g1_i1.p1  ORF type:complete len:519 (+),score=218.22 TRINITY_DN50125_c0_g1_i1:95-1558(+)